MGSNSKVDIKGKKPSEFESIDPSLETTTFDALTYFNNKDKELFVKYSEGEYNKVIELGFYYVNHRKDESDQVPPLYFIVSSFWVNGNVTKAMEYLSKLEKKVNTAEFTNSQLGHYWRSKVANLQGMIYWSSGDFQKSLNSYKIGFREIRNIGDMTDIASISNNIGVIYWYLGDLNNALHYHKQSLNFKLYSDDKVSIARSKENIGLIYYSKGELDIALDYFEESSETFRKLGKLEDLATSFEHMGSTYIEKGEIDIAISYLESALNIFKQIENEYHYSRVLFRSILAMMEIQDFDQMEKKLDQLVETAENSNNKVIVFHYKLADAIVKKQQGRGMEKLDSIKSFKEIIDDRVIDHELTYMAMLNLCELLIMELKMLDTDELQQEVTQLLDELERYAKIQHSYTILVNVLILRAQFALHKLRIGQANQLLTQAEITAKEKGLERLSLKVSFERNQMMKKIQKLGQALNQNEELVQKARDIDIIDYMKLISESVL